MQCKLTIDNKKAGGKTSAEGEITLGPKGFSIFYGIDGDRCLFTYSDASITQSRRGEVCLSMHFTQGKETACSLGENGCEGSFPVFTNKIAISQTDGSISVLLDYICGGENIVLNIEAVYKERK